MAQRNAQFERIASEYDDSLPAHVVAHYLAKRVRLLTALLPGRPVCALDVGCGTGSLAARLQDAGWLVTGLDQASAMLRVASARGVRAVQGSSVRLPFADESFHAVYCVAVLHHVAEHTAVRDTLREMVRVTRRGGVTVVWDHNPLNPYWPIIMARVSQDTGEERLISVGEMRVAMEGLPLYIVARQSGFMPDFVPAPLMGPLRVLEGVLEATPGLRRILCAHNVVIAHKNRG